jgi:hypothetical protein
VDKKKYSGVGVLDKGVAILTALESGPHSLAELVTATKIARPTAHRLAVALEFHRLVARDLSGRFVLGPRAGELLLQPVKINFLPQQIPPLPCYEMQRVKVPSCIAAKVTCESVLQLQNDSLGCAIQFQSAQRSLCKPARLLKCY